MHTHTYFNLHHVYALCHPVGTRLWNSLVNFLILLYSYLAVYYAQLNSILNCEPKQDIAVLTSTLLFLFYSVKKLLYKYSQGKLHLIFALRLTFTFMHLADAFIQSNLLQAIHIFTSMLKLPTENPSHSECPLSACAHAAVVKHAAGREKGIYKTDIYMDV